MIMQEPLMCGNDNAGALDVPYGLGLRGASHRFQVKKEESRIGSHSPLFTMSWGRKIRVLIT